MPKVEECDQWIAEFSINFPKDCDAVLTPTKQKLPESFFRKETFEKFLGERET